MSLRAMKLGCMHSRASSPTRSHSGKTLLYSRPLSRDSKCFSTHFDKFLTLKKANMFVFFSLNRNFALTLQRFIFLKMKVIDLLENGHINEERHFSFEVLPPLKGNGTEALFRTIDTLKEFNPQYINITTHHSEYVYKELEDGNYERQRIRRRPGTIAIAAAIQQRYHLPVIPHIICSGATAEDIEYELIDLQFLGIQNVLLLRGDKAQDQKTFTPIRGGYRHTTQLIEQVVKFNEGFFRDGTPIKHPGEKFSFGVACYPEKHEEAPNLERDMEYLKKKQDLGAKYAVTQLFFDNEKFYEFVEKARQMGITIPIVPGLKPFRGPSP